MQDILTNPITILCLGVVFLLISLLFFYFKRSISMIERAQMEQARVLQSFITNMEMSHMAQAQMMQQNSVNLNSNMNNVEEKNDLIHVSDDEGSDSDSDSDTDSESGSDNESQPRVIELSNDTSVDINNDIKIIQLQDSDLEKINSEHEENLEISELQQIDEDSSSDDDDTEDDDTDDESDNKEKNDDISKEINIEFQKKDESELNDLDTVDIKSLSVQTLREIAEEKNLITKGERKNKRDLLKLLQSK